MRSYALVTRNGRFRVLDEAPTPEELDYDKAKPNERWGVCARLNGRLYLIAKVNLLGTTAYNEDFEYAVDTVKHELQHGDDYAEFDRALDSYKWPVVDIRRSMVYLGMNPTGANE